MSPWRVLLFFCAKKALQTLVEVWVCKAVQVGCPELVGFLLHDSWILFKVEVKVIFRVEGLQQVGSAGGTVNIYVDWWRT